MVSWAVLYEQRATSEKYCTQSVSYKGSKCWRREVHEEETAGMGGPELT